MSKLCHKTFHLWNIYFASPNFRRITCNQICILLIGPTIKMSSWCLSRSKSYTKCSFNWSLQYVCLNHSLLYIWTSRKYDFRKHLNIKYFDGHNELYTFFERITDAGAVLSTWDNKELFFALPFISSTVLLWME